MAEPSDLVQPIKHESTATGGDDADADPFAAQEIIDEFEDALSVGGVAFQEVGGSTRDSNALMWRDDTDSIKAKDANHGTVELLSRRWRRHFLLMGG